jgi:sirohydrochlorin ferrochelatase
MAHGSRVDEANSDLQHVVEQLRARGQFGIVEGAFLELAEPDIKSGAASCVSQGARRIVLLPYFLSAGVHVRRDLASIQRQLASWFPEVTFVLAEPLGRHPLLLDIVNDRACAAQQSMAT